MSFEDEYFDALQSIEGGIIDAYAQNPKLQDHHVKTGLKGLMRYYNAALKKKKPPMLKLAPKEQAVFDTVKVALEARMSGDGLFSPQRSLTLEEAVQCVKRIHRSVDQWMRMHGGSGNSYLEFVKGYKKQSE